MWKNCICINPYFMDRNIVPLSWFMPFLMDQNKDLPLTSWYSQASLEMSVLFSFLLYIIIFARFLPYYPSNACRMPCISPSFSMTFSVYLDSPVRVNSWHKTISFMLSFSSNVFISDSQILPSQQSSLMIQFLQCFIIHIISIVSVLVSYVHYMS